MALNVAGNPSTHAVGDVTLTVGLALTVTALVQVLVQPLTSVSVTVRVNYVAMPALTLTVVPEFALSVAAPALIDEIAQPKVRPGGVPLAV